MFPRHRQPASSDIYTLYCDGASRGNPGQSGCGFVLFTPQQTTLVEYKHYLGTSHTNNVAEYQGLIAGLATAQREGVRYLRVRADSTLICMQMVGAWEVHATHLQPYRAEAAGLLDTFDWWDVQQVPREENKIADRLSNEAIDQRSSKVYVRYDEAKDDEDEGKREVDAGAGHGRAGADGNGPMRTKRLAQHGRLSEDSGGEEITLPLKRQKQSK